MALISCKECDNKISSQSKVCPQCGAKNSKRPWGFGKIIVAGFFILFAISWVITSVNRNTDPAKAAADDKVSSDLLRFAGLRQACKDAVLPRLKAPATAEFPEEAELRVSKNDPKMYFVLGSVDAQNSFSAKLRQRYICEAKTGASWNDNTVTKVTIGP